MWFVQICDAFVPSIRLSRGINASTGNSDWKKRTDFIGRNPPLLEVACRGANSISLFFYTINLFTKTCHPTIAPCPISHEVLISRPPHPGRDTMFVLVIIVILLQNSSVELHVAKHEWDNPLMYFQLDKQNETNMTFTTSQGIFRNIKNQKWSIFS